MNNPFYDQTYRAICSEKTLQSNSNGFFMDFVEQIVQQLGQKWINVVFGKLKTDKERVRILYTNDKIYTGVSSVLSNVQPIYRKKDAEFARSRRLEAERICAKDLKKSLALFSQSILRSPKTGENKSIEDGFSLPLALLGRANVLIKLEKYSKALSDIQMSFKEGLPNVYKSEAYWKMGICFKALNDQTRAEVSFNLAEKLLTDLVKLQELKSDRSKSYTFHVKENRREEPPLFPKAHKDYPSASHKIAVKCSKELGRYIVANEQISTGESIAIEAPYVSCLLPEKFGTHCHHCFDRLTSPVGCDDCSGVAFCKPECKIASSSYHRYECKFMHMLIGSGMSIIAHTALRMITQKSCEESLEIYKNKSKERIYSLCTNANVRFPEDFFQRSLMAVFLLTIIKKSGYFSKQAENSNITQEFPSEDELCIAEMILFNLQILQFNTHEVYETLHTSEHRFTHSKTEYIGVALYPTVSLFNHDCSLAVARYFVGNKIVIRALKPFQVHDPITENYGPIFTRKSLPERQRSLVSRYWFTCKCNACIHDWPSLTTGLGNVSKRIRCPSKLCDYLFTLPVVKEALPCPKCKSDVSLSERILLLNWCEEQYKFGFEKMAHDQDPKKAIDILSVALDTFYRISSPPCKETQLSEEVLLLCLADSGNVYEALCKKS